MQAKHSEKAYLSTKEGEETIEKGEATTIPYLEELNAEEISKLKFF